VTTAHHPTPTHVGFRGEHEWLWIGLSAIAVAVIAGATMWFLLDRGTDTGETAVVDNVSGFEYTQDASTGHVATPGVTGDYIGYSDELYPSPVVVEDYEYGDDATTGHVADGTVTSDYVGGSGELDTDK
jgi:hypothetical protein